MLETRYCHACGAPVYRVTSHRGRRFFVDAVPVSEGTFSLDGDSAKFIPPQFNADPTNRYRAHKLTCTGKGRKAEKEALQRTLARAREGL